MGVNDDFDRVRRNLENAKEVAEHERAQKLYKQRIDLARAGIRAIKQRKVAEAIACFEEYLRVLAEIKKVPEGGLSPANFDLKKDANELLMITGIYWDLIKVYDRSRTGKKHQEFLHYLDQFVKFSVGLPYHALSAETIRKYLTTENPQHRADFNRAYQRMGPSRCFIAASLADLTEPETILSLQSFRDQVLRKKSWGRSFIYFYYKIGPHISAGLDHLPRSLRKLAAFLLNHLARAVEPKKKLTV